MEQCTLLHMLAGNGMIQVDFKNYLDWEDKLIFLEKGQYIKFLSNSFSVRKIVFTDEDLFRNSHVRVLFKHLVSLGYINYTDCEQCQRYLSEAMFSSPKDIIDVSINQWYWQNPFNAKEEEYQVIFDVKELIDQQFKHHIHATELINTLSNNSRSVQLLMRDKVGLSVKNLLSRKKISEGQKEVAFTDKPIQHIAYDLGFNDPAYFNRVFRQSVGMAPSAFRDKIGFELEDVFEQQLFNLIHEFHTEQRSLAFYANKMFMSKKTLSKQIRNKLNTSVGQLIRAEIIKTAKQYLSQGQKIKEVAFALGFEEANHFSAFFKHHTQLTPTAYANRNTVR